jgi:hypothetical protein
VAIDAVERAEQLTDLRERYWAEGRNLTRGSANQLVDLAFEHPVLTARVVEQRLEITRPAALTALRQMEELGILTGAADDPRGQLRWRANGILDVLAAEQGDGPSRTPTDSLERRRPR